MKIDTDENYERKMLSNVQYFEESVEQCIDYLVLYIIRTHTHTHTHGESVKQ